MSTHYEWVGTENLELHPRGSAIGEHCVDDEYALIVGFDDCAVIEGSEEDLRKFAQRILDMLDAYRAANPAYPNGQCPACGTGLDEHGYCTDVGCCNCGKAVSTP